MDPNDLERFRKQKDEYFGRSHNSPLDHDAQHGFTGLNYYDANPDLVFTLPVTAGDHTVITVQTSDGQVRDYARAGTVELDVDGEAVTLTLYSTGHPGYFVPFRDATSGKSTYGAGRYLDIDPNEDGTVTIDFNYAYNPFCAYNEAYSCPLPPIENWLPVPIKAGELDYSPSA